MKLFRPVRTNRINQRFGDDRACVRLVDGLPVQPMEVINKTGLSCPVGFGSLYRSLGLSGHNGQDNAAWHGEPVYHCADFIGIMTTEHDQDGGLGVDVISQEPVLKCTENGCSETHYIKIRYWHGMSAVGYDGKVIKPGDEIMKADSSGASSGDHLHWAPKWCNKDGSPSHPFNGYRGCFSPTPYLNNDMFVCDEMDKPEAKIGIIGQLQRLILSLKK